MHMHKRESVKKLRSSRSRLSRSLRREVPSEPTFENGHLKIDISEWTLEKVAFENGHFKRMTLKRGNSANGKI